MAGSDFDHRPSSRKPLRLVTLRLFWGSFAISFLLIAWIGSFPTGVPVSRSAWGSGILAAIAVASAWRIYTLRTRLLARAARTAAEHEPDAAAKIASVAHLLGFASAESVLLCGVVAHFVLHSPAWISWSFSLAGGALLVLYWPASPASLS